MKKYILSSLIIISLASCKTDFKPDLSEVIVTKGEADFSTYVSLGNSLTSGHRDGALYRDGQLESYPAIIASQMKLAGGGEFKQPLIPNNIGGFSNISGFSGKYTLKVVNGALVPIPSKAEATLDKLSGSFNNMGVSGAKSFHLIAPHYGDPTGLEKKTANPYFVRFASSPDTSILKDAMSKKPTFFSLWIGNNDVLSYAMSGGTGKNQKGNSDPKTYGYYDITDPDVFAKSITAIIKGMASAGAKKGVIANIPNVETIPFFTTIPYNAIPLTEEQANLLNTKLLSMLKNVLESLGHKDRISLAKPGQNPILIEDKKLEDLSTKITAALKTILKGNNNTLAETLGKIYGKARHANSSDLVLLTTKSILNTAPKATPSTALDSSLKYGISFPIGDEYILTKTEIDEIKTATQAYNNIIKGLANTYGLAFVDANAKMIELNKASGITINGVNYNTNFAVGGAFSLDGIHLTGKGASIIANEFIKAINNQYHSTLRQVNPNKYSGITFP